jgi:hypothetical protein
VTARPVDWLRVIIDCGVIGALAASALTALLRGDMGWVIYLALLLVIMIGGTVWELRRRPR